ncbi:hypothetical protein EJ110_NYTH17282 [Nymphaea thermarum]|nr:hypothetical protein EJ110_NYTH17282 [Nymphaea thermarum]
MSSSSSSSAAKAPEKTHSVKLVINPTEKKVVYAEAGKDFVDLLFSLLTLPLKTVTKILSEEAMPGSLTNLHGSIETLDDIYMEPPVTKEVLLSPEVHPLLRWQLMAILPSPASPTTSPPTKYYRCNAMYYNRCRDFVTTDPTDKCSVCGNSMGTEVTLRAPTKPAPSVGKSGKSVRDLVGYVITDDLFVLPITTLSLVKKMDITDTTILEEKDIAVGNAELCDIQIAMNSTGTKKGCPNISIGLDWHFLNEVICFN